MTTLLLATCGNKDVEVHAWLSALDSTVSLSPSMYPSLRIHIKKPLALPKCWKGGNHQKNDFLKENNFELAVEVASPWLRVLALVLALS